MRDAPEVDELLATARDSLLANLLPTVAPERKREVLMIANAIAIARRSLAAGEAPLRAELAALRAIYPLAADVAHEAGVERDIRRGVYDAAGPARSAVEALLMDTVVQKLRENRPKLVAART